MLKSKYTEKYWFAIGYHDGLTGVNRPPSKLLVDYLLENKIDILKNYNQGHIAGVKDIGLYRSDIDVHESED
jgi:hypothetical protein